MPKDATPPLTATERNALSGVPIRPDAVRAFFSTKLNDNNLKAVLRVATKLISGEGCTHAAKPGESFRQGEPVRLDEDLHALRETAALWLPYQKSMGDLCLDKGHGWALNHPIQKLIDFQHAVLTNRSLAFARREASTSSTPF